VQGPCDLDQLQLRAGEPLQGAPRVDVDPDPREGLPRLVLHAALVPEAGAPQLPAQEQVVRDGQLADQRQLLEDGAHSVGDRARRCQVADVFPADGHGASVPADRAGEHLDQRRLAGAVLAEQRVHLPPPQAEGDPVDGGHAPVALGDPLRLQDHVMRVVGHRRASFAVGIRA
jgi:hypothetical protein